MAIGTWEDFTDKYGFGDGAACEDQDFRARDLLVKKLNAHPSMVKAQITVVAYDRPGVHNPCMLFVFLNPRKLARTTLLRRYFADPKATECPVPDDVDTNEIIAECYRTVRRKGGR